MVPKKSPKRPNIPKHSIINPINDLFAKINSIPVQKHKVPLILVGLVKNVTVRCGPMIKINPITNNMFPNAKNAESKNAIIPNKKKNIPPAVNPTPNSISVSTFLFFKMLQKVTYFVSQTTKSYYYILSNAIE